MATRQYIRPGEVFHRWTALSLIPHRGQWLCRCACGVERPVQTNALRNGHSKSCGCFKLERLAAEFTTHGRARSPEYVLWRNIIGRCHNPRNPHYAYYGGRGITVCAEWRADFLSFLRDVGERPSAKHSLDRFPNGNGNYEGANVRWATRREQQANLRSNVWITAFGQTLIITEWAQRYGWSTATIAHRLRRGWAPEIAVSGQGGRISRRGLELGPPRVTHRG
jgi:hypothetical protein